MATDDKGRAGLDLLLSQYPDADVALVEHQRYAQSTGPWTCVDLIIDRERKQFAIWNYSGDVYCIQTAGREYPGAVEDEPTWRLSDA